MKRLRKLVWWATAVLAIAFLAYRFVIARSEKMAIMQHERERTYSGIVVAKKLDVENHRFKDITIVRGEGARAVIPIPSDALFEAIVLGDSVAKDSGSCVVEVFHDTFLVISWSICP